MTTHNVKSLPLWAQHALKKLADELAEATDELSRTKNAQSVLTNREWFTLPGPDFRRGETIRRLWYLDHEHPLPACSLAKGDIILVGRAIDKNKVTDQFNAS